MRIGIDCRMYGSAYGYAGEYTRLVLSVLVKNNEDSVTKSPTSENSIHSDILPPDRVVHFGEDQKNPEFPNSPKEIEKMSDNIPEYVLFFGEHGFNEFIIPSPRFRKVLVRQKAGSFSEQIIFLFRLYRESFDNMFFPHIHVPILYFRPYIATIHDLVDFFYPDKRLKRGLARYWYIFKLRFVTTYAKKIVTMSEYTKRAIIETFNIHEDKVVVIPPLLSRSIAQTSISQEEKKKYLMQQGILGPYILCVGDLREYKNIPRLLKAYHGLIQDEKNTEDLVIIGKEDPTYHEIRGTIIELGIQNRVHIFGYMEQDKLSIFYQDASVYILPSLYEGSELPILEALQYKLPIACAGIPAITEKVEKDSVIFFRPLSVDDMASALAKAVASKNTPDTSAVTDSRKTQESTDDAFYEKIMWLLVQEEREKKKEKI